LTHLLSFLISHETTPSGAASAFQPVYKGGELLPHPTVSFLEVVVLDLKNVSRD